MPWELIVVGWVLLMFLLSAIRRQSIHIAKKKSEQFGLNIDNYVFPLGVSQNVKKNYPHLTTDQIDEVLLQLKEYFHMCNIGTIGSVVTKQKSSQVLSVGMPSKIVDQAWHEFILFTKQYSDFCEVALGRFLHHTPSSEMANADDMNRSMRNAWRIACHRKKLNPTRTAIMPPIFSLDERLSIADGFHHSKDAILRGFNAEKTKKERKGSCGGGGYYGEDNFGCSSTGAQPSGGGDGGGDGDGGAGGCGGGCGGD